MTTNLPEEMCVPGEAATPNAAKIPCACLALGEVGGPPTPWGISITPKTHNQNVLHKNNRIKTLHFPANTK
jgi:hypothetical protein